MCLLVFDSALLRWLRALLFFACGVVSVHDGVVCEVFVYVCMQYVRVVVRVCFVKIEQHATAVVLCIVCVRSKHVCDYVYHHTKRRIYR